MTKEELQREIKLFSIENRIDENLLEVIPKKDLVEGQIYTGTCRNASEAQWMGDHFQYWRTKWGSGYFENIKHFEDDDGFDVFIPIHIKSV